MPASSAAESAVESGDGDDDEDYLRKPEREFTYRDPKVSQPPPVFPSTPCTARRLGYERESGLRVRRVGREREPLANGSGS
jgi:hypothetical protein